ncbi:MAG: histidine phosphatase family protein [Alicyclobacillus sp.]|nr:histidine phosphatase family protein [Alicyclobacillus sp.]
MPQLMIIRHGETEADLLDVHEGRADYDLTYLGMEQARKLAHWMKSHYIPDVLWASPMKRTAGVAHMIANAVGRSVRWHD